MKFAKIVSNMSDPKWVIIWTTHMNTRIVPFYVVSFKLNPKWHNKFLHLYMDIFYEGTRFFIFTSLHSLVDLYFQTSRFKLGMYEMSCYLDVKLSTCCWIEILMQNHYCTCIYLVKLGFMLFNIVFKYTSVFLI
jgi:hypothetical protein